MANPAPPRSQSFRISDGQPLIYVCMYAFMNIYYGYVVESKTHLIILNSVNIFRVPTGSYPAFNIFAKKNLH